MRIRRAGTRLRYVLVAATAAVLVVPGSASAAGPASVTLSAAGMVAELRAVAINSTAAARSGWRGAERMVAGDLTSTARYVVDPAGGTASVRGSFAGDDFESYAVAGRGSYVSTDHPETMAAVRMMGRPAVRYVFTAGAVSLSGYARYYMPLPAERLAEDVSHPGTRTTRPDGSRDYSFRGEAGVPVSMRVSPAGVLVSDRRGNRPGSLTFTYAYGPQHVDPPADAVTVDSRTLRRAVPYLTMLSWVRNSAEQGAIDARTAANGGPVRVAALRTAVRRNVAKCNRAARVDMMRVADLPRGARVSATNPWTHRTVWFAVRAAGTRVVVSRT